MKKAGPPRSPRLPVLAPAIALQLCVGILYMWSVFQPHVVRHFGWDFGEVALTSSFMLFAFVAGTLGGGLLLDRVGTRPVVTAGSLVFSAGILATSFLGGGSPRLIYATYGLVAGTGTGLVYGGVVSCVQRWYPHRRGFAAGIAAGAFGFSVVLLGPVAEALIARFGVLGAFRALGTAFLVITLAASRLVSDPPAEYRAEYRRADEGGEARQYRPSEVLGSPIFYLLFLCLFFEVAAWVVLLPVIKTIASARGLSRELALTAVMVTGIANASGRVISAWLSDRIGRTATVIALCLVTCGASLWMNIAVGIPYIIAVFLIAFAYGGPSGIFPPLVREVFGSRHAGTNFGMVLMALGFSSLVFSRVSQALSAGGASSGDYSASFYMTAGLGALSAALMFAASRLIRSQKGSIRSRG